MSAKMPIKTLLYGFSSEQIKFAYLVLLLVVLLPDSGMTQSRGLSLGIDLFGALRGQLPGSQIQRYEGVAEYHTNAWVAYAELGSEQFLSKQDEQSLGQYDAQGTYGRLGVAYNLLKGTLSSGEMLRVGIGHARSFTTEQLQSTLVNPVFGNNALRLAQQTEAQWWELSLALRARTWRFLMLGFTARYQVALKVKEADDFSNYYVAGYGRADKNRFGFAYQLLFHLPFKKP